MINPVGFFIIVFLMRLLRKALNTGVEVALCNISSFDVQFFYTTCYLCER